MTPDQIQKFGIKNRLPKKCSLQDVRKVSLHFIL